MLELEVHELCSTVFAIEKTYTLYFVFFIRPW